MSFPSFSTGEVLTAADMNAVGLWRNTSCTVTSVGGTAATASNGVITVGAGNTSVTIAGAFSADFENYRIIWSGGTGSTTFNLQLQLGSTTTGYYGFGVYGVSSGTAVLGINDNNAAAFRYVGGGDTSAAGANIDIRSPQTTAQTQVSAPISVGTNFGQYTGRLANNTQYTAFTLKPDAGTITGGTIRVYGYRN